MRPGFFRRYCRDKKIPSDLLNVEDEDTKGRMERHGSRYWCDKRRKLGKNNGKRPETLKKGHAK